MSPVNSFDVIRLLAALLVVYGHAYPLTGLASTVFAGNFIQSIGVKIFFVISGYLIVGSWIRDPSIWSYAKRRALRIFPGLIVVVLVCAFILGPSITTLSLAEYFSNFRTWSYVGSNIFLKPQYDLPGVFAANPYPGAVNGSLWSLPAEIVMYVLAPIACVLGMALIRSAKWGVFWVAGLVMSLSIWFVRLSPPSKIPVVYGNSVLMFLDVAPYFFLGSIYKIFNFDRRLNLAWAVCAWIALSLIQPKGFWAEIALYITLPSLVLALGLQQTEVGNRVKAFGDISYGVYLYGFPVQQLVAYISPLGHSSALANTAISLPLLIVAATFSWRFIERPMLRFKATSIPVFSKNY